MTGWYHGEQTTVLQYVKQSAIVTEVPINGTSLLYGTWKSNVHPQQQLIGYSWVHIDCLVTAKDGDVLHADLHLCTSMSLLGICKIMVWIASTTFQRTQFLFSPVHPVQSKPHSRGSTLSHNVNRCNLDETPQRPCFSLSRALERVKFFCLYCNEFAIYNNSDY